MKNILFLVLFSVFIFSCKKKKETNNEPAPVNTTTGSQPQATALISVKVDGVEKHCNSCYSGIYSGGLRDSYFNLAGSSEQILVSWDGVPKPGTYTLVKYGEPFLAYGKGSYSYAAKSGTLNVVSIDTSSTGAVNKMTAFFSFKTDTLNGLYFNLTEGTINLK